MSNLLEKLYDGQLYPAEQFVPPEAGSEAPQGTAVGRYDAFKEKLPSELEEEFEELLDGQMLESSAEQKQAYIQGMQLGANFMLEIIR